MLVIMNVKKDNVYTIHTYTSRWKLLWAFVKIMLRG